MLSYVILCYLMLSNIILSYLILSYLVYVGRTENSTQYINISPLRTDLAVRLHGVSVCMPAGGQIGQHGSTGTDSSVLSSHHHQPTLPSVVDYHRCPLHGNVNLGKFPAPLPSRSLTTNQTPTRKRRPRWPCHCQQKYADTTQQRGRGMARAQVSKAVPCQLSRALMAPRSPRLCPEWAVERPLPGLRLPPRL